MAFRVWPLVVVAGGLGVPAFAAHFSGFYKVVCPDSERGCNCQAAATPGSKIVFRFSHAQKVKGKSGIDETADPTAKWVELQHEGQSCFLGREALKPVSWNDERCPEPGEFQNLPFAPPAEFLQSGSLEGEKRSLGAFFPTFYNIADERHHPGEKSESLLEDGTGRLLAKVSPDFRASLDLEGTGVLSDGRTLNVGTRSEGVWRYVVLPRGSFGLGILEHSLYPYRVAAVDFDYLCEKAGFSDCADTAGNRRRLVGSLLFLPRLKNARMPNGARHDGFVCAHDVGGAIQKDRIDLFVGPMGGGNPYLPDCQSANAYTEHGVQSLVPSDWKRWRQSEPGKFERVLPYEYRETVPEKGLEIFLVKGAFCKSRWP